MLREKGAYWSCLKIGHRQRDYRSRKACGENITRGESGSQRVCTASSCGDPLSDMSSFISTN